MFSEFPFGHQPVPGVTVATGQTTEVGTVHMSNIP